MHIQTKAVAKILGLRGRDVMSTYDLAQTLATGISVGALDRLCAAVAPDDPGFCHGLIPRATLNRRRSEKVLSPGESELLGRLAQVWAMAREVYGTDVGARRFLHEPHVLLHGEKPIEVARTNLIGAAMVEDILGRLQYGSVA